jgi:hypothetical protein
MTMEMLSGRRCTLSALARTVHGPLLPWHLT